MPRSVILAAACIAAVCLCLAGGWLGLARWLVWQGRRMHPAHADAAIILGAYTDGYRPGHALRARLKVGLQLYRAGWVNRIVVSGGRGEDESVSESSSMKRFLIFNGVPPDVIVEERHSADTWENLRNSRAVMARHGFKTAVIVTSDYHLPRAMGVARQLDMAVSGCAARSGRGEFRYALREVPAWVAYTLKGRMAWRQW